MPGELQPRAKEDTMELSQLRYFKAVADCGKISEAAGALFISAPALSTSIARLEKELGTKLFRRTNNKITLNQQGEILLRHVNRMLAELESAEAELHRSLEQSARQISIATVASSQWIDMVTAFSEAYPRFTLSCTSVRRSELAGAGLSPHFNFLLAAEDDLPEEYRRRLDSVFLFDDYPVLLVSDTHPFAARESVWLEELRAETVYLPMSGYSLHSHVRQMYERCGIPFPEGNSYSHLAMQQMVSKGLGVAFSSRHVLTSPGLPIRRVGIANPHPPLRTCLYRRRGASFTDDEELFFRFITDFYRSKGDLH